MANFFTTTYIGKASIRSHYGRCSSCSNLTMLQSYKSTCFATLFNVPLFPTGTHFILDECPLCGQRGITTLRKHVKVRKQNIATMMDGFAADAETPSNCAQALRTLMLYDEVSWFNDVKNSYGQRFYDNATVQHVIAQGLCRFGEYADAITYCQKAIVLGEGPAAEELLKLCQKLDGSIGVEAAKDLLYEPESNRKAFIPLLSLAATIAILMVALGISIVRTHKAWVVNGTLREYSFFLDGERYTLAQGSRRQIKLKLGKHSLEMNALPTKEFSYSVPFLKQLLQKKLLIINPDGLALLTILGQPEASQASTLYHGKQVYDLSGVGYPLIRFKKQERDVEALQKISLYRPDTHLAMVERLSELGLPDAARFYAQRVLLADPASGEALSLIPAAIEGIPAAEALAFLSKGIKLRSVLIPWHICYQDLMQQTGATSELLVEYKQRCETFPDEPKSYFLLGRVVENRDVACKFFEQSEKGNGMNGLGYYAIAYDHYLQGEYALSLKYSEKSVRKSPKNTKFIQLHENNLLALRRFDELLTFTDSENGASPEKKIVYLTCAGFHQKAEALVALYGKGSPVVVAQLNASRFYAIGNLTSYLSSREESGHPLAQFEKLLYNNQIEAAHKELSKGASDSWEEHLVMYCFAEDVGNKTVSAIYWAKVVNEFQPHTPEQHLILDLLKVDVPPDPDRILPLDIDARQKALLCMSLAYRFPECHAIFLELSEKYNFTPVHPQLLLKKLQRSAPLRKTKRVRPAA